MCDFIAQQYGFETKKLQEVFDCDYPPSIKIEKMKKSLPRGVKIKRNVREIFD